MHAHRSHLPLVLFAAHAESDTSVATAGLENPHHLRGRRGVEEGDVAILIHKAVPALDAVALQGTDASVPTGPLGILASGVLPQAYEVDDVAFKCLGIGHGAEASDGLRTRERGSGPAAQ